MQVRPTVRVLLLDPQDRLLLFRGRLPAEPDGSSFWFTCGGGVEPGETLEDAARREVLEETGIAEFELGPAVWRDEGVMPAFEGGGPPMHFQQTFYVGRCAGGGDLSREGWTDLERRSIDEARWWTLAEIASASEIIYPRSLPIHLPDIIAGRWPSEPIRLDWD